MAISKNESSDRDSAWQLVQRALDAANATLVEWQEKFAARSPQIASAPPEIPDTPAHARGQAKRQRHADAVARGEMSYKDIALERQAEFAEQFAALPDADRATLNDWAERQQARTGSPLGVVLHHAVPWPIVFLVARYGEEVEHWPTSLTDGDRVRLTGLDRGGKPLKFVETLDSAALKRQVGARVYLFARDEHAAHVGRAIDRAKHFTATGTGA